LLLSDAEKATLAEMAHRLKPKALEELAAVAKPDTLLAWYRKLIAHKFDGEEEPTTVRKHSRAGYNIAALLFFFLFLDNLLRRAEEQGWKGFWPCSGRFEVVVLFGMLSLVAQFVYWSRIVSGLNQEHA
jgi:hypothetical protein